MSGHTKSNNTFVYQLVLFASLLFPTEKVRDVAEDYAEYLRERPEKQESPWQFCSSIMRVEHGYHPKAKTLLAILAAATLFLIGIQTDPVALSFLTVGLPVAFWVAIDGSTTARYSPPLPHAVRCVLLPFLAVALLSAGFFLVSHAAVSEPFLITPGMARIIIKGAVGLLGCFSASFLCVRLPVMAKFHLVFLFDGPIPVRMVLFKRYL